MNAMKASIKQFQYCHIFELMFSCCFLYQTELDTMFVYFYKGCYSYRWKCKASPKVRILRHQNSQTLCCLVKSHLKQSRQIVRLIFSYSNSGYSIRIFTDVYFAYKEKEIQLR